MKRLLCALLALCLTATSFALAQSGITAHVSLKGASAALINNVDRAMLSLDGVKVEQGGRFSFNSLVGARTAGNGYDAAPNGRGAAVTGGGVAITAAVMDLALQASGAEIEYTHRAVYGSRYNQNYVDSGSDAILVDYASHIDYAFVNRGEALTFDLWRTDDELFCSISFEEDEEAVFLPDLSLEPAAAREIPDFSFDAEEAWDIPDFDAEAGTAQALPDLSFAAEETEMPAASACFELSGDENLISNVRLAADSINGCVLMPGDSFSFNKLVGPRSSGRGYRSAVNGRGVKVTGGGVAQTASVVFMAVRQLDDIAVTQKETYGSRYNQSYVESSNDAILTDYSSGTDFRFKNTGTDALRIEVCISDGMLRCDVYQE